MATAKKITMDELLASAPESANQLVQGETVEGVVLSVRKHEILIDLGAKGVGFVPRREAGHSRNLTEGWEEVSGKLESGEVIEVIPYDANRGGLLVEYEGIRGFLPVSQLSAEHYPRVGASDKDEILSRLNALIDKPISVRILDADRKTNKLIFSEKEAVKDGLNERFESLKIGDDVEGIVTGVVDFGVFVNVDGIEGLIHISEISWERVSDPKDYVKIGDTVKARIISIDKDRLSLSMKQLTEDPWLTEVEDFKKGSKVEGTVTRITPFGAFVQISPAIEALVHVSELGKGNDVNPENVFTLNERKEFVVIDIDKEGRKISLSLTK